MDHHLSRWRDEQAEQPAERPKSAPATARAQSLQQHTRTRLRSGGVHLAFTLSPSLCRHRSIAVRPITVHVARAPTHPPPLTHSSHIRTPPYPHTLTTHHLHCSHCRRAASPCSSRLTAGRFSSLLITPSRLPSFCIARIPTLDNTVAHRRCPTLAHLLSTQIASEATSSSIGASMAAASSRPPPPDRTRRRAPLSTTAAPPPPPPAAAALSSAGAVVCVALAVLLSAAATVDASSHRRAASLAIAAAEGPLCSFIASTLGPAYSQLPVSVSCLAQQTWCEHGQASLRGASCVV
jgi:hypothetical protein